jgi:hypothetical protein
LAPKRIPAQSVDERAHTAELKGYPVGKGSTEAGQGCSQLFGPSPKTDRDTAEAEYLTLMLNVCSGALPLGKLAEKANKGTLDATKCADPESLFRNIPPC